MKFYLYKEGGQEGFSHGEGGGTTSFGVALTQVLEVLAILEGGGGGSAQCPALIELE